MKSFAAVLAAGLALAASGTAANAQISDNVVKLGVLTDMSSLYADATGKGSVAAVEMAVADYGGKVAGVPIEVISADHQNKPDVGVAIARNWYDNEKVDAIMDVPTSSVALPVSEYATTADSTAAMASDAAPASVSAGVNVAAAAMLSDADPASVSVGLAMRTAVSVSIALPDSLIVSL